MKFLFDLLPVILFFLVFRWAEGHVDSAQSLMSHYFGGLVSGGVVTLEQTPILLATVVIIVTTFFQIVYLLVLRRKIETPLWVSLIVILIFGGATIYFHDENFIKWKPTVLYWCFSFALLLSQSFFKKNLIRSMMQANLQLPNKVWDSINLAWGFFFLAMGFLNLYLAFVLFRANTADWVNFKLFGFSGLMLVFIVGQAFYFSRYLKEEK